MKLFITSDLHFGHRNIGKFCPKTRGHWDFCGVTDTEKMNNEMIVMWNEIVEPQDTVYILGDVAFMPVEESVKILQQLHGTKILIKGNHDHKSLTDQKFRMQFSKIYDYYEASFFGTFCTMFHYPIAEWNKMHRGAVHFHGHCHGNTSGLEGSRGIDVGFDATGKIVMTMEEAVQTAMKGVIRGHHGKGDI